MRPITGRNLGNVLFVNNRLINTSNMVVLSTGLNQSVENMRQSVENSTLSNINYKPLNLPLDYLQVTHLYAYLRLRFDIALLSINVRLISNDVKQALAF